jgi:hypothetical protein
MAVSKPLTAANVDQIVSDYAEGEAIADIAIDIGCSRDTVKRVLTANGIAIRSRGRQSLESERTCSSFERMKEDAAFGSMQLLMAIQRAGLLPA